MGAGADSFQPLLGSTPARRRQCPQQHVSPSDAGQAPWTTSRCNRLLRPISSRIAALRKEKEGRIDRQRPGLAEGRQSEHTQRVRAYSFPERHSKSNDDPEWIPEYAPRKRLKRTYSSRGNDKGVDSSRGGKNMSKGRELPERTTIQLPPAVTLRSVDGVEPVRNTSWQDSSMSHCLQLPCESVDPEAFSSLSQSKHFLGPHGAGPFRRIAQRLSPENWISINGLYNGVDALIRATSSTRPNQSLGARSLFASCIKKVPEYFCREQKDVSEREDPEEVEDVALSVYTELESLGQSDTGGWKPLRELVRSHGIALLREAILDHSIPTAVARGLVILCQRVDAIDEAEELVAAMLSSADRLPKPRHSCDLLFERQFCLTMFTLRDFALQTLRYSFFYRQLATLLSQEIIPIEWVSSPDMASVWNMTIMHIAEEGPYALEAANLLRVTISESFGYDQGLLDKTLTWKRKKPIERPRKRKRVPFSNKERSTASRPVKRRHFGLEDVDMIPDSKKETEVTSSITNLLTVLLTVDSVRESEQSPRVSRYSRIQSLFKELELAILGMHELSLFSKTCGQGTFLLRVALVLFAKSVLFRRHQQESSETSETRIWHLLKTMITHSQIRESLSSALCGLALCHAKAGLESSLSYLQGIQQSLVAQSASTFNDGHSRHLLRKVWVDAAFEFADETKNQRHLNWALELEEMDHDDEENSIQRIEGRTPLRPSTTNLTGYRWEEGISEWVARTPAAKFSHVQIPRAAEPMPITSKTLELTNTEESESPITYDALESSPLRTTSFCYVRIETSRRSSAPSHQCMPCESRHGETDPTDMPPSLPEQSKPRLKLPRTVSMSKKLPPSGCTQNDEADEQSTPGSSQASNQAVQETKRPQRSILREISNLRRNSSVLCIQENGVASKSSLRSSTRFKARSTRSTGHPSLPLKASWLGAGEGSEDELGV